MRAAVLEEPGRFSVRQWPDPKLGAGQVLVRVAYVSICGSDIHAVHGEFGARVHFPTLLGHVEKTRVVRVTDMGTGLDLPGCTFRYDRDLFGRNRRCLTMRPSKKALQCERWKLFGLTDANGAANPSRL